MPAPQKTTLATIVAAGREVVERDGMDGLTMQAVAEVVGVRPPSLYKHVRDRRALRDLVVGATLDDLGARMTAARDPSDPRRSIRRQLEDLRRFAHESPVGFGLAFATHGTPSEMASVTASVTGLIEDVAAVVGDEHALDGARLLVAWANGFLGMELGGGFRLGGDPAAAWEWGLDRIIAALE